MMPLGNCSSAAAHSSTPLAPRCAAPATFTGLEERQPLDGAGDQPRHRHRVAADVEDAAAGEVVGVEPVLGVEARHREAEARLDRAHLADRALADQLEQPRGLRVQAVHEGLAEEGPGLARRVDHRVGLPGGEPERLLAQHVLAGLGGLDRPLGVARVRRRDVDRLDLGVGEQRLVAREHAGAGELLARTRGGRGCGRRPRPACRAWSARRRRRRCGRCVPGPRIPQRSLSFLPWSPDFFASQWRGTPGKASRKGTASLTGECGRDIRRYVRGVALR